MFMLSSRSVLAIAGLLSLLVAVHCFLNLECDLLNPWLFPAICSSLLMLSFFALSISETKRFKIEKETVLIGGTIVFYVITLPYGGYITTSLITLPVIGILLGTNNYIQLTVHTIIWIALSYIVSETLLGFSLPSATLF